MYLFFFLIFAPKHRLCVIVRTASARKKNDFLQLRKNLYITMITWVCFCNGGRVLVLALDNVFGKDFKNFAYAVLSINLL